MHKLLVATQNPHKIDEYRDMLDEIADIEWLSLADVGLAEMDVEETGSTFAENAILKARAYGETADLITFADDSGIAVDALDGAPGVYSARYGAPDKKTDEERLYYLLENMENIENRAARFVCTIAIYVPDQEIHTFEGVVEGEVTHAPRGENGFGYDPIFQLPSGQTTAQLSDKEKHAISHRGNALRAALPYLRQILS